MLGDPLLWEFMIAATTASCKNLAYALTDGEYFKTNKYLCYL